MSTRSFIGVQRIGGGVEGVYCHWDGYPTGVGRVLLGSYADERSVEGLVALGSISELGESPETTLSYHRWRGEPIETLRYVDLGDLAGRGSGYPYVYVFTPSGWVFSAKGSEFRPLTPADVGRGDR